MRRLGIAALAAVMFLGFGTSASASLFGAGPNSFQEVYYQPQVLSSADEAIALLTTKLHGKYTAGPLRSTQIVDVRAILGQVELTYVKSWVESGYNWVPYNSGAWIGGHYVPIIGGSSEPWEEEYEETKTETVVSDKFSNALLEYASDSNDDYYAWRATIVCIDNTYYFGAADRATAQAIIDAFTTLGTAGGRAGWRALEIRPGITAKDESGTQPALRRANLTATGGVVVESVLKDSPAALAGIKSGDIITAATANAADRPLILSVNGYRTKDNLAEVLGKLAGDRSEYTAIFKIQRDGKQIELPVTYTKLQIDVEALRRYTAQHMPTQTVARTGAPAAATPTQGVRLGIAARNLTTAEAQQAGVAGGVFVTSVDAGSLAAQMGMQAGDFLLEIDGSSVRSTAAMREALATSSVNKVKVFRNGAAVELGGAAGDDSAGKF